ncbi:hypothetical protein AH4AK4_2923 [Aeromonas hydrophila 4AK4]|nr:hypothetical protein AH4AK4_2923 [Aeromonas hydrophila 4AK4]
MGPQDSAKRAGLPKVRGESGILAAPTGLGCARGEQRRGHWQALGMKKRPARKGGRMHTTE